jgi:hypothetical protein
MLSGRILRLVNFSGNCALADPPATSAAAASQALVVLILIPGLLFVAP